MNHWWRAYNTAASDPKLGELTDWQHRCWFQIMCMASENDGAVPVLKHVAYTLRAKPEKAAEVLSQLHAAGLLDKTETGFVPHNWSGRQYKSDVSTDRVKRFRNAKRNVSCNEDGNAPEQSRAETEQSRTDARTDLQKRAGDFRQAIVSAYASANSTVLPETSRAELWISQGYDPEICLAVIAGMLAKKPTIGSLSYFDSPIAEAHTKKAPPRITIGPPPPIDWEVVVRGYKQFGRWARDAGNDPTSPACRAPPEILRKYGFEPVIPALRAMEAS